MNSVTTQYRRSQPIARPMPGGKGPAQFVYGVMVSGCFEPVCYQFADWVVGDFNGQAEKVECEHSTDGLKTATASQSGLSGGSQKLNGLYTCATDTSMSASVHLSISGKSSGR